MSDAQPDLDQAGVDLAINRVLEAEREARDQVEQCRAQAARLLAAAEDRSRRIARRAEQRIHAAHRVADQGVAAALQAMAEHEPIDRTADAGADALVDRAAGILADEIIGVPR